MVFFPSNSHLQNLFPTTYWFYSFVYIFIFYNIFIYATFAADSEDISYNTHCSAIIPAATLNGQLVEFPYLNDGTGYLTGGNTLFPTRSSNASDFYFSLFTPRSFRDISYIHETTILGVYRVEARLTSKLLPYGNFSFVGSRNSTSSRTRRPFMRTLNFGLHGFWSEPTGKLCMVGRAPWQSEQGKWSELEGVLKLNIPHKNSTIFTSLTKGSLQSVSDSNDPRYFDPIKIVYLHSFIGNDVKLESECVVGGEEIDQSQSLSLEKGSFCSNLWGQRYYVALQYALDCVDRQNCSPFERDIAYLPQSLFMNVIQCFEEKEKVRILMKFSNWSRTYGEFDTRTTLIGEGSWDREKNQLCIVACKILHPVGSPGDAYVDDCSTRLTLRFPAIQTITNDSKIAGEIWTNKTASDPGYFKTIKFSSWSIVNGKNLPKQKYVYTQVGLVRHSCYANKPGKNRNRYPNAYSRDMSFDVFVKQSNEIIASGQAAPISVGDKLYQGDFEVPARQDEDYANISKPINISYRISIHKNYLNDQISLLILNRYGNIDITAEGVYNPQTGVVCMVGCRGLYSDTPKSHKVDCEILVNIEFPPLYSKDKSFVEGFVFSKRENTDPLYFKGFNITSASFNTIEAKRSIRRIDLEIIMALVSNTLSVIFLASQIFYVKKHPEKLPFVSILMLGILTLGQLIPLMLNVAALILKNQDQQNVILQATGWLEVKEISAQVVTLVAVVFLSRLLQLAWTSRSREENGNTFWQSELNTCYVSFFLYLFGALINLFVNVDKVMMDNRHMVHPRKVSRTQEPTSSILQYFSSYTGLIRDGYLLPQIIFNVFHNSRESALSPVFYMGTTLLRLLPHVYDLYRIHNYIHQDFGGVSYIYANHTADFYSIAWDIIIPCVCVLLAVIIFLQQRFGGESVVPKKYRQVQLYEKVPVETDE